MVVTRVLVRSSVGLVDGVTVNTAVSPASLKWGVATETTPFVSAIFRLIVFTAASASSAPSASTTMVRGPLNPGPKPSARAS